MCAHAISRTWGEAVSNEYPQQPYGQPQPSTPPPTQYPYGTPQFGAPPYGQPQWQYQYGPPPFASRAPYRSTRGLAIGAVVGGAALLTAELLEAVTAWSAADQFADAARAGVPAAEVFTGYDFANLFWLAAALGAFITTCLWLWFARQNSELLSRDQPTRARGWIWAGWVVPIVSLWFPFQIVRDIRKAAEMDGVRRGPATGLWWGLWLAATVLGQFGTEMTATAGEIAPEVYAALGPAETVSLLLLAGALAVWAPLVLGISRGHHEMAYRMGLAPRI